MIFFRPRLGPGIPDPSRTTYLSLITMTSKLLLGFNAAVLIGAYILYAAGVRLTLDDGYEMLPSLVDFAPTPPRPSSASSWGGSGEKTNYTCTNLRMQPKFLSYDPIMVYIEDFMSPYETQHLRRLASVKPPYAPIHVPCALMRTPS